MELDGWTNLKTGENWRAGKASNFSAWTLREKLAEVRARAGDVYNFYVKLQTRSARGRAFWLVFLHARWRPRSC